MVYRQPPIRKNNVKASRAGHNDITPLNTIEIYYEQEEKRG